jgi:hypothetical protein
MTFKLIQVLFRQYKFLKADMKSVKTFAQWSAVITLIWLVLMCFNLSYTIIYMYYRGNVDPHLYYFYSIRTPLILLAAACMALSFNFLIKKEKATGPIKFKALSCAV